MRPRFFCLGQLSNTAPSAPRNMQAKAETLRSYDRDWEEIESMLEQAELRMETWVRAFFQAKKINDRATMMDAARNKKALEGVIKTLKWVLGEEGIEHPLH